MKKIINVLKSPNIGCGYLYFYIHFIVEIACFYSISRIIGNSILLWTIPFVYDAFAFVPQSLIGYFSDKHPKINVGLIGVILLLIGFITYEFNLLPGSYTELIILCLGNSFIHVDGAEVTLRLSNGKLSHSSIFVGGGSFGVITGKLLSKMNYSFYLIVFLILTIIPCTILGNIYRRNNINKECSDFKYNNLKLKPYLIIILAVFVVIVRGYMGYGIPTSWNKTTIQTILLFVVMGFGKALGGVLSDAFGIRKAAIFSVALSIPFLLCGDNIMFVSLIGILLFSMTMSITLALLVSVLNKSPGLAFGLTTIGLFLGTIPIFFIKITSFWINASIVFISSTICLLIFLLIIRKDNYGRN